MSTQKRGLPANQVVRDYARTLDDFSAQVDRLVTQLTGIEASMPVADRQREVCVAIWAAITAAFEASSLLPEEKQKLTPLLQEVLVPYWEKHCIAEQQVAQLVSQSATPYLSGRDPHSQVVTATAIVDRLLDQIGATRQIRPELAKSLIPLFAHRILGDIQHINQLRNISGIHFPLMVTLCVTLEFATLYGPAIRALRWI